MEKKYSYSVGKIRKVNEKNVVANVLKFRYNDTFGDKTPTSLCKWNEKTIWLTREQMSKFKNISDDDTRRAYLTHVLILS